jgi:hypothetical protein
MWVGRDLRYWTGVEVGLIRRDRCPYQTGYGMVTRRSRSMTEYCEELSDGGPHWPMCQEHKDHVTRAAVTELRQEGIQSMITYDKTREALTIEDGDDRRELINALQSLSQRVADALLAVQTPSERGDEDAEDNAYDDLEPVTVRLDTVVQTVLFAVASQRDLHLAAVAECQSNIDQLAAGATLAPNAMVTENGLHQIRAIAGDRAGIYGDLLARIERAMADTPVPA